MTTLGIDGIMKQLPHRYPMLMIDRVLEHDHGKRIVCLKNVTVNEPCFQGHFPSVPVMPGVLQLEAMAQAGGILLIAAAGGGEGNVPYLMSIDKAKFRRVIRPGDQMRIICEVLRVRSTTAVFKAEVRVDGELASEAQVLCMITDQKASA